MAIEIQHTWDVRTDDLIDITRDQIAALLFRSPNEPFIVSGTVNQPMPHKAEIGRLTPKEAHRAQAHGLFQLWSRLVDLAGVEQANFWTFGIPVKNTIYERRDGENCNGK